MNTVTGTTDGTLPSVAGNLTADTRICVQPGFQAKEWKVLSCCGTGFGDVYKVKNQRTDVIGAMKIESVKKINESTLVKESKIYKCLSEHSLGAKHVAEMIAFEQTNTTPPCNFLIITYLGANLKDLRKNCNDKLELSSVLRIGIQTFLGIKMLHDVGYLHRHLRPSCFMLGSPESPEKCRVFHLTDFQVARRYLKRAQKKFGVFREEHEFSGVRMHGYMRYVSVSVHNGNEHRCRDDIWSWIYILAELLGKLPWNNVKVDPSRIQGLKMITPDTKLFAAASPKDPKGHFLSIVEYLRTVHADSKPDYAGIYRKLKNAMNVIGSKFSDPYDWESGEQSAEGFLSEADYQKHFSHEEMKIIRKDDAKVEVDGTAVQEKSSTRVFKQQVHKHCKTDSLEVTTFIDVDTTQQSSKKKKGQARKDESKKKSKEGECSSAKKQSTKKFIRKKLSNDRVNPNPPTPVLLDRETTSEYKNVKANEKRPGGEKERGSAVVAKPTPQLANTDSSKRRKQRIASRGEKGGGKPTGGKSDDKTKKKFKRKKPHFKNDDMTVDKTREQTKETVSSKEDSSSGSDKHPTRSTLMGPSTNRAKNVKPRVIKSSALSRASKKKTSSNGKSKEAPNKSREAVRRKPTKKR